jgi:hypothetical protein
MLAQHRELEEERRTLEAKYEAEDAAHSAALAAGFRADSEPDQPDRTAEADRTAARADVKRRMDAWSEGFAQFLDEAVRTIKDSEPGWQAELKDRSAAAEAKREEARRILAEADAEVGDVDRLARWLRRTAGDGPLGGEHIGWERFLATPPQAPPDLDALLGAVTHA